MISAPRIRPVPLQSAQSLIERRPVESAALGAAAIALVFGIISLFHGAWESFSPLVFLAVAAGQVGLVVRGRPNLNLPAVALAGLACLATATVYLMPDHIYGESIRGVIHRSAFVSLALLALAVPALSAAVASLLGGPDPLRARPLASAAMLAGGLCLGLCALIPRMPGIEAASPPFFFVLGLTHLLASRVELGRAALLQNLVGGIALVVGASVYVWPEHTVGGPFTPYLHRSALVLWFMVLLAVPGFALATRRVFAGFTMGGSQQPAWTAAGAAGLGLTLGMLSLLVNFAESAAPLALLAMGASLLWLASTQKRPPADLLLVGVGCLLAALLVYVTPEYVWGFQINAIMHRSVLVAFLLLCLGLPAACASLYYAFGATPGALDYSRYPVILLPIALAALAYALALSPVLLRGLPNLDVAVLTRAYGEATAGVERVGVPGMLNHILGTLLLIGLTASIALPVGVGVGVLVTEYPGRMASFVGTASTTLRVLSVYVIGIGALNLVRGVAPDPGTFVSDVARGVQGVNDARSAGDGSYLTAAVFLSLLAIPVVARAAEEGLRSVPPGIREGSWALGASDGYGLLRILLPWAMPNIMTGLLIGCAEAAGSVAVLLFLAGDGQFGVGPLHEVTSLAFLILDATFGSRPVVNALGQYRFTAALLLLLLTMGMTFVALYLRRRLGGHKVGA